MDSRGKKRAASVTTQGGCLERGKSLVSLRQGPDRVKKSKAACNAVAVRRKKTGQYTERDQR